ncbi:MAG: arginine deiminase-related protein [Bacteroidota bacterium]
MTTVITTAKHLDFTLADLADMPMPNEVLMVSPRFFEVQYEINPHMKNNIGEVDYLAAQNEWTHLKKGFEELDLSVHVIDGVRGFPDMVFCANQSLPDLSADGQKRAILSIMHAEQRKGEVEYVERWYDEHGYTTIPMDHSIPDFEGMGDALWHAGKRLIWGGYGFRSSLEAYRFISDTLDVPVIALELIDPKFYHLDTCLCVLNETTALIYPQAFTDEGRSLIRSFFPTVLEASKYEAEELFACNATCPDGKNVFIQQGCTDTNQKLRDAGFIVHEFATFEFLKSGGSVFCMKLMLW